MVATAAFVLASVSGASAGSGRAPTSFSRCAISRVTAPWRTAVSRRRNSSSCCRWIRSRWRVRSPIRSQTCASKNQSERYISAYQVRSSAPPGTGASWNGSPKSTSRTPPKGSDRPRASRSARSMPSMTSALTIEISSMISTSSAPSSVRSSRSWYSRELPIRPTGSRRREWMVCPPTLRAATPVGATTATFRCSTATIRWSTVDLPVPARPVTSSGDWSSSAIASITACWAGVSVTSSAALTRSPPPAGRAAPRVGRGSGARPRAGSATAPPQPPRRVRPRPAAR